MYGLFKSNDKNQEIYGHTDLLDSDFIRNIQSGKLKDLNSAIDNFYFLQAAFFDFIIKNFNYDHVVEAGSYEGKLIAYLAHNNPDVTFLGYDLNPSLEKLNSVYKKDNLTFHPKLFDKDEIPKLKGKKTLFITKGTLAVIQDGILKDLLNQLSTNEIDIALAEPCGYTLNRKSHLCFINKGNLLYSHPYSIILKKLGYNIIYDSQSATLSYLYQPIQPYYLTFCFASKTYKKEFENSEWQNMLNIQTDLSKKEDNKWLRQQ